MSVKVRCLHKNRNHNGVIQSYILQDQNGQQIEVKRPQLLELLQNPNYDFIDLKLSADGKIIDKTEQPQELPTFTAQDYAASMFRNGYDITGKTKEEKKAEMKQCLQNEIATGKIDASKLGCLSDSLELVGIVRAMKTDMIKDLFNCISEKDRFIILNSGGIVEDRVINDALNKGCELYAKKYTEVVDSIQFRYIVANFPVVGYQLKNVGSEPIEYKVVDTNSGKEAISVIQPGEVKALTRVETAMLLSEARFSFKIRNAKVCKSSMNTTHMKGKYEDLATYYLSYIKGLPNPENYSAYDTFWLALPESEQHRFYNIGLAEIRGIVGTGSETNSAAPAKNNSKSKPNIFKMFK